MRTEIVRSCLLASSDTSGISRTLAHYLEAHGTRTVRRNAIASHLSEHPENVQDGLVDSVRGPITFTSTSSLT